MTGAKVRVLPEGEGLEVIGHGRIPLNGYAQCGRPIEILGPASIVSMTRALSTARSYLDSSLWITEQPAAQFPRSRLCTARRRGSSRE